MNLYMVKGAAIVNAQASDRMRAIPYRPEFNAITRSVEGSILLQQILYWWGKCEGKPFYKFRAPAEHDRYKAGDSWTEELGFTGYQFDKALKSIGVKITKGISLNEMINKALVIYWTDSNRLTWYKVNQDDTYALIGMAYDQLLCNFDLRKYIGKHDLRDYIDNFGGQNFMISETTQETTPESELDKFFGKKEPGAEIVLPKKVDLTNKAERLTYLGHVLTKRAQRLDNEPWLTFDLGHVYKDRDGVSAQAQQRVNWLIKEATALECLDDKQWKSWCGELVSVYKEGGGTWSVIKEGIEVTARNYVGKFAPASPRNFAREIRKARARQQAPAAEPQQQDQSWAGERTLVSVNG